MLQFMYLSKVELQKQKVEFQERKNENFPANITQIINYAMFLSLIKPPTSFRALVRIQLQSPVASLNIIHELAIKMFIYYYFVCLVIL